MAAAEGPTVSRTGVNRASLLAVIDLKVHVHTVRGIGTAVNGLSFNLSSGETLGLVGESGSGKSLTALSIVGLHPQPACRIAGGRILFRGEDLIMKSPAELQRYRGKHIASIFQDPMTALNPVLTIGDQLGEVLRLHQGLRGGQLRGRAVELLRMMRISAPESRLSSYPHELSGGMRQRVVGAIALSGDPEVLIADEPTTSLDVTVQAAYLAVLREIQRKTHLAILFITHDFGVVGRICDRVAVMYAGRIVETGDTRELLEKPAHPYTEALLNCVPDVRRSPKRLSPIKGEPPSIHQIPQGCPFAPRCSYVMPRCREEFPPQVEVGTGHTASCWRHV